MIQLKKSKIKRRSTNKQYMTIGVQWLMGILGVQLRFRNQFYINSTVTERYPKLPLEIKR